ncbi:plasmid stabilization protein [Hoeflea sp.]|uniref:plasmid stabilization protein n=1 Tax=Hoeflea sp. TaxID=1940281 RepID=UPI0037487C9C
MPDLLIRNLPEQLRTDIGKAASASGRSLSDEAKHLIRKGLSAPLEGPEPGNSAWDELRNAIGAVQLSDSENEDLLVASAAARRSSARQTPEFE